MFFFFFFQAEDGIRDRTVTGVQTCALPISLIALFVGDETALELRIDEVDLLVGVTEKLLLRLRDGDVADGDGHAAARGVRSEERRVGKEGRSRWARGECIKKEKRVSIRMRE